jgi:hypothetical protein
MVSVFHFSRSLVKVLAGPIGLLLALGLSAPAEAHPHSLEDLLHLSLHRLMQVEVSTHGMAPRHAAQRVLPDPLSTLSALHVLAGVRGVPAELHVLSRHPGCRLPFYCLNNRRSPRTAERIA